MLTKNVCPKFILEQNRYTSQFAQLNTTHQIQVDKEAKSLAVGTDLTTRAKATNTDVVGCKSVSCNTTTLDKAAVQSQADGMGQYCL